MKCDEIKSNLESKFEAKVTIKKRQLFDDIIVEVPRQNKAALVLYMMTEYKTYVKLRSNMDELIYSYMGASKEKIEKIRKTMELQKIRFKWLHDQIKDEQVFLVNAIKEDEDGTK